MASAKSMAEKPKTFIWAVDPSQNPEDSKNLVKEMKLWSKQLGCQIQPVTIFSKRLLSFPLDLSDMGENESVERLRKSMTKFIKQCAVTESLPPELIFIQDSSTRKKAAALAKFAESKKVSMIFANTRAQKTRNVFRLGGFAETLVTLSTTPVVLLNPSAVSSGKLPSILFPTDFSRDSKNALVRLEPWAKSFNAEILLYNQVEGPAYYAAESTGFAAPDALDWEGLLRDIEHARNRHARAWSRNLQTNGIACKAMVQRQRKSTASDILEVAKKSNASLIALATHSGPLARFFLGSIARDVLLQATCPVMICYRPKGQRKVAQPKPATPQNGFRRQSEVSTTTEVHHG